MLNAEVRRMRLEETSAIIDYFITATPEYLEQRTLQNARFRYVKTHMSLPGPINSHQAVTRWVFEQGA
jgi:hypothetical protein